MSVEVAWHEPDLGEDDERLVGGGRALVLANEAWVPVDPSVRPFDDLPVWLDDEPADGFGCRTPTTRSNARTSSAGPSWSCRPSGRLYQELRPLLHTGTVVHPDRRYEVRVREEIGAGKHGWMHPGWMGKETVIVPGRVLAHVGLQLPTLWPVQAMVLHLAAV